MQQFFSSVSKWHLPTRAELKMAMHGLTKREWMFFLAILAALAMSVFVILILINNRFLVRIPERGGTVRIGVIGTPRFVNPVLEMSDADRALTNLVFAGLFRKDEQGAIVPDLADSYAVSADGLTYTVKIKSNAMFQNNTPVTANDVAYTIQQIGDTSLNSSEHSLFEGVTVAAVDPHTITFTLEKPYAPFLNALTVGILPQNYWANIGDDTFALSGKNINAVGAGPFKITKVSKNADGTPSSYTLIAFKKFANGEPLLHKIIVSVYPNETVLIAALQSHSIDIAGGINPDDASTLASHRIAIQTTPLPRVFGLYFNLSSVPFATDQNVIKAFSMAIDRQDIVQEVLNGYGTPATGPIPSNLLPSAPQAQQTDPAGAIALLTKDGYTKDANGILATTTNAGTQELSFSISTGDAPELREAAELVANDLQKIGVAVTLKVYDIGILNQTVIRPRTYDALFFGQIVSEPSDLYAFWDSSERTDPGLNVDMYAGETVDAALDSIATAQTPTAQAKLLETIETTINGDAPALFIYEPDAIYALGKPIYNFTPDSSIETGDITASARNWFVRTDSVWKIFAKHTPIIN